jgi:serine/threonine protein phosphatase PrpC
MYGEQPVGPLRVWAQGERAPGLSMTRALGDWLAASVGLIDEPEIMARQLAPEDRCGSASTAGIEQLARHGLCVAALGPYCPLAASSAAHSLIELSPAPPAFGPGHWLVEAVDALPHTHARPHSHRFLILMSDGISEFMDNEEVMAIVHEAAGLGLAPHEVAARLVREARRRWAQGGSSSSLP